MVRFRGDSFKKILEIENYSFQPDDIVKEKLKRQYLFIGDSLKQNMNLKNG